MNSFNLIKIVDAVAFALFVLLTSSGILLHYAIPPRSGGAITIWNMTRHEWGNIHFYIATTFFTILFIHLILHRSFIVGLFQGKPNQKLSLRTALGLVALLALFSLAIAPFLSI